MIDDLTSGQIDAGVLWGPMAGFYAKKANPPLHVTPLVKETTGPRLAYRIGMGVRPADQNWKRLLNRADPGEPAGDQQDPARFRRSVARRERSADQRGDDDEIAMM